MKLATIRCQKCELFSDMLVANYDKGERVKCPICNQDMVRVYGFSFFKFKDGFTTQQKGEK